MDGWIRAGQESRIGWLRKCAAAEQKQLGRARRCHLLTGFIAHCGHNMSAGLSEAT